MYQLITVSLILYFCLLLRITCFECPSKFGFDSEQIIATGSNRVFDRIAQCSYEFNRDGETGESFERQVIVSDDLSDSCNSTSDSVLKIQFSDGKIYGTWAFTRFQSFVMQLFY